MDPSRNMSQQNNNVDSNNPRFVDTGFQQDFNQKSNFGQSANTFPTFMPHQPDPNDSYCRRLFRNRRQASSVLGGFILMLSSGLHVGWGIWRLLFIGPWLTYSGVGLQIFIIMAWSIGAFIGGLAGSVITRILRRDCSYYISGVIMTAGNVLIIIWDAFGAPIAVGRLFVGIAHGLAFVTLITHAGENAAKNMRGTILSIINCMIYTGIFASVVITGTTYIAWFGPLTISSERIVGIAGAALAVGAIACTIMMSVESVPFLLRRNSHEHAKTNLKRLRGVPYETIGLAQELEEFQLMVIQDKQDNWNIFTNGNGKPLVLMILMRLMVALTNNFLINTVALLFVAQIFDVYDPSENRLVPLVFVAPRLGMSVVQIFYADVLKRKIQICVSSVLAALALLILGIVLNTVQIYSWDQWRVVDIAIASMWLFFQLTCSFGMDQMQDIYLSEAFSTAKKTWSIAFVAGIEHIFHMFMIGMVFVGISATAHVNAIIFVSAVVVILLGLILVLTLPETRNMSLKQANDAFINNSVNMTSPFA